MQRWFLSGLVTALLVGGSVLVASVSEPASSARISSSNEGESENQPGRHNPPEDRMKAQQRDPNMNYPRCTSLTRGETWCVEHRPVPPGERACTRDEIEGRGEVDEFGMSVYECWVTEVVTGPGTRPGPPDHREAG